MQGRPCFWPHLFLGLNEVGWVLHGAWGWCLARCGCHSGQAQLHSRPSREGTTPGPLGGSEGEAALFPSCHLVSLLLLGGDSCVLEAHCWVTCVALRGPGQTAVFSRLEGKQTSLDKPPT